MSIKEIRMPGINVTRFHGNQVSDQLVCRTHCLLEEGDDNLMEFLFEAWISPEKLIPNSVHIALP